MPPEEEIGKYFELEETSDHSVTFLKVRLYPSHELLQKFESIGKECELTDEFVDDQFQYAQRQEFVRKRGSEVVHRTRCVNVTVGCHVYREAMINTTPENTHCFLRYSFKRQQLRPRNSELSLGAYLDTMTSPFKYKVLSIRAQLKRNDPATIIEAFKTLLKQLECLWGNVVPVGFSKFMFALKCLPDYEEYEDFFIHFDNIHEVIAKNVECLLSATELATSWSRDQQLYIWTLQEQLERLSAMRRNPKFDYAYCQLHLDKFYNRVVKGKMRFVLCDPYDI